MTPKHAAQYGFSGLFSVGEFSDPWVKISGPTKIVLYRSCSENEFFDLVLEFLFSHPADI